MKISQVIELEDGSYRFSADLTEEQHGFLIEFALKELMRRGLVPVPSSDFTVMVDPDTPQSAH